eukprot:Tamp_30007.p1 GENE.Tamp_30007~~Tamp_30007.p1  ORF type:complete len:174 (+),score=13.36 Tamp_30007:26-523(+)
MQQYKGVKMADVHASDDALAGTEAVKVDFRRNRYPCAVVWQPFPPLTWLIPCIGHTGITDSQGVVHDFQGPYTIIEDNMMLGRACRYLPLDPAKAPACAFFRSAGACITHMHAHARTRMHAHALTSSSSLGVHIRGGFHARGTLGQGARTGVQRLSQKDALPALP